MCRPKPTDNVIVSEGILYRHLLQSSFSYLDKEYLYSFLSIVSVD